MPGVLLGIGSFISSREVAVIDANSEALGVTRLQLMENAGRAVADYVASRTRPGSRVVVFAGPGGNGGDGLAAARHLAGMGRRVTVVIVPSAREIRSPEARAMYNALEYMELDVEIVEARWSPGPVEADVVIDALLGVGLRGAPRSPYREAIEAINASKGLKVAVDVPSGLDADTGEAPGPVVRADATVTLHKPKPGLARRPDLVGELIVAGIGAPTAAEVYAGPGDVEYRVPRRSWETRKGRGGRVLVVGGSRDYTGAPIIAALAAEAAGVDLVFLASTPNVTAAAAAQRPTLIPVTLEGHHALHPDHVDKLKPFIERADAIAIGMGLGRESETLEAAAMIVEAARGMAKPVVVDADALRAEQLRPGTLGQGVVATPHDGEYRAVYGEAPPPVTCLPRRVEAAAEAARRKPGLVLLLKGPVDVVTDGSRARLNRTGAPSMSAGGTGDALAGLAAALLAKGMDRFNAALVAAYVNGLAGALAYARLGDSATALDAVREVPRVLNRPLEAAREAPLYRRLPLTRDCGR